MKIIKKGGARFFEKKRFSKKIYFQNYFFFQNISGTTSFRSQEIVSGMFWRISVLHENLKKIEKNCKKIVMQNNL